MSTRSWITRLFGRVARTGPSGRWHATLHPLRAGRRLGLEQLEGRLAPATLTVNSTQDTANPTDPYLSLREAVAIVNSPTLPSGLSDQILAQISGDLHGGGTDTIRFDPNAVSAPILLGGSQLELRLLGSTAAVTVEGGDSGVTVDGNNASRVLQVDAGVAATLDHLTITHGSVRIPESGAGIATSGTLTVMHSTISSNSAFSQGGGISNAGGMLTVTDSTVSSNSGGGIYSDQGTLTLSNSTINSNGGLTGIFNSEGTGTVTNCTISHNGDGIFNAGTLTVTSSTISANSTPTYGGGILNQFGTLTVSNSTISNNSADFGAGIENFGTLTVANSTISSNSASGINSDQGGGGIHSLGTLTVTDSTITANSARFGGGGIAKDSGTLRLQNTIVAGNSSGAPRGPDIRGGVDGSSSSNLVGIGDYTLSGISNGTGSNLIGSPLFPIDPRLGPLADNGGPTLTHALLDDSPARGAGDPASAPPTDQRGLPRIVGDETDLGAFQTQTVAGPQVVVSAPSGVVDPPLDHVCVTFNHPIDPDSLTTAQLGFTGPGGNIALTGVTAVPSTNNQQFEVSFASQADPGNYALTVGADVRDSHGAPLGSPFTARFILFSPSGSVLTVNSSADTANDSDPYLSLREAIAIVNSPTLPTDLSPEILAQISGTLHGNGSDVIVFDPASVTGPITLGGSQLELRLSAAVARVRIDGGDSGVTVDGNNSSRVLQVDAAVQASLDHITVTHGKVMGFGTTVFGGGIYNEGTLTVTRSTFTGNSATSTDFAYGGGIDNAGLLTVTNCTLSANSVNGNRGSGGGGIRNTGVLAVTNSTFSANSAAPISIIGGKGGGIYNKGTVTVTNSTLSANSAGSGGGIDNDFGTLGLANTIVASNTSTSSGGPDINGGVESSSSYNLIGIADITLHGISDGVNGNQIGSPDSPIDPRLGALGDYGGPTQTMPLLPGSPALNTGDPGQAGVADQRGALRSGGVNIGAFQASASAIVVTAPATATAGVAFDVGVAVYDIFGQLAVGYSGTIHFTTTDDDPGVVLPPDYTFGTSNGGMVTFSSGVTLFTPGEQTLTVTDLESGITGSTSVTL
jgi:hypothetical protein